MNFTCFLCQNITLLIQKLNLDIIFIQPGGGGGGWEGDDARLLVTQTLELYLKALNSYYSSIYV